ncbi:MAG: radical SAM protein [Candidatus Wallbacteria bacterium]|nr:radical SAM protein [Candidatus Wallbacteria bacterium]
MKPGKVLLVRLFEPVPFVYTTPPTGFLYVASSLFHAYPGLLMKLYDFSLPVHDETLFQKTVRSFQPDTVLFSGTYVERDQLFRASAIVRSELPQALIIAGGAGPSSSPLEFASSPNIDYIITGEGEERLPALFRHLESGSKPPDGLGFIKDGSVFYTPPESFITDLDSLAFPQWSLLDLPAYSKVGAMNGVLKYEPYATVVSSRGCPFDCSYCHKTMGRVFRPRSPQSVVSEIMALVRQHGVREIHFIDDCFNLDPERAKEICRLIIASGIEISIAFPNAVKGDLLDEELIVLLKKAGCFSMTVAVESASAKIRSLMNKRLDLRRLEQNTRILDRLNIYTTAYFIFGLPGESEKQMTASRKFACRLPIDSIAFFRFIPFPGTAIRDRFFSHINYTGIPSRSFEYFSASEDFNLSRVSTKSLKRFSYLTYLHFYFSIRRIAGLWRKYPKTWRTLKAFPMEIVEFIHRFVHPRDRS